MSATGRGAVRDKLDRYYTPDPLAEALVAVLGWCAPATVLEPSVGGGAFARAVRRQWPQAELTGVDLDAGAPGLDLVDRASVSDFLDTRGRWDLVVGNPPFALAESHVRHALTLAPVVGVLLRLGFLASRRRVPFWHDHPATHLWVLARRPSFRGGRTDATDYGLFLWNEGDCGPTTVSVLDWSATPNTGSNREP